MLTLRQLFEKYGYSTEFKFKTNKKFMVPLNHLEITSWGPMGDGIFPKHNACLCDDCKRSAIGYYHDYLQRDDDRNIIDGFTYPDVLNLEVDVRNFYIDAFPANFNTSPKLNEEEITKMFYNRIMNANKITIDIEDFNTQCETYDEDSETIFTHTIFDKVFENDLMLLNKLKSWSVFDISKNLYKESQDTIDRFFEGFEQYLENDKNLFASNVENLFASYKVDLGKELKKQVGVEKDENYVIIDTIKFLVDFNNFRIAAFDVIYNKWCQTYMNSKFKYIEHMFLETDVKIKVKECDSSYILIFLNNENFEIVLNEWIDNNCEWIDNNCLTYDNKSDGESYTDDDGIEFYKNCSLCGKNKEEFDCSTCRTDICNKCHEKHSVCVLKKEVDDEFWVENNLIQTVRNLNNKIKELTYDDKKLCFSGTNYEELLKYIEGYKK